ncbi:hypothetical protein CEXT_741111 [Caerostris extrusa]|uniref:Uncharacterized protein n=1 Tax=Caerostris extrusa TaxID=172846 RepID=A0AAV4SPL8_CAEEX|nr:hypothetical protein CEXT_741111 [Caerostris extrusa]
MIAEDLLQRFLTITTWRIRFVTGVGLPKGNRVVCVGGRRHRKHSRSLPRWSETNDLCVGVNVCPSDGSLGVGKEITTTVMRIPTHRLLVRVKTRKRGSLLAMKVQTVKEPFDLDLMRRCGTLFFDMPNFPIPFDDSTKITSICKRLFHIIL